MAKTPKTNGNSNVSAPATTGKKRQSSKSTYFNAANEESRSPKEDSIGVRFYFEGYDTEPVDLTMADLADDMRRFCELQGANIKLQRSYNTAENPTEMKETCEATRDNLLGGIWTGEREAGGLRIADLIEALVATLADEGQTVDDARRESIRTKLHDETARDMAKASPKVQKHLTRIQAEKAAAKAASAASADTSKDDVTANF